MSTSQEHERDEGENTIVYRVPCSSLRKGGYVVLQGAPCKILDTDTSNVPFRLQHVMLYCRMVPYVSSVDYDVINVEGKTISLLNDVGAIKEMLLPDGELGASLSAAFSDGHNITVTCLRAMGNEEVISFKVSTENVNL
ncbi:hypothetical protein Pelo_7989 [Pelomyxa schiedti]|nr:hypothetical protein Pelo_7989 [Pelomyxa schiedti]